MGRIHLDQYDFSLMAARRRETLARIATLVAGDYGPKTHLQTPRRFTDFKVYEVDPTGRVARPEPLTWSEDVKPAKEEAAAAGPVRQGTMAQAPHAPTDERKCCYCTGPRYPRGSPGPAGSGARHDLR